MPENSAEEDTEMTTDATETAEAPDDSVGHADQGPSAPDPTETTPDSGDEVVAQPVSAVAGLANAWTGPTAAAVVATEVVDEDALLAVDGDSEGVEEEPYLSPYDRPGKWYVVHTQSGYEKKVKRNIVARTESMNMEHRIYEVEIPTREVTELKNLKKVVSEKKLFPGYLLVRCRLDDDAWYVLRNTPGVTGFVNQGGKPSPLRRKDVETFLGIEADRQRAAAKKSKPMFEYAMAETVRVVEGPFADFLGEIIEINEDQFKVKVLLNIFGRETPVELEFAQVARL